MSSIIHPSLSSLMSRPVSPSNYESHISQLKYVHFDSGKKQDITLLSLTSNNIQALTSIPLRMTNMQPRPTRIRKHIQNILLLPLALHPLRSSRWRGKCFILQPIRLPFGFDLRKGISGRRFADLGCFVGGRGCEGADVTEYFGLRGEEGRCVTEEEEHGDGFYSHDGISVL